MIRHATEADVPRIVEMGRRFVESTAYQGRIGFDPARVESLARGMLSTPNMAGFVSERDGVVVGMLGMHVYEHPMSGERVATETVWWMDPEHRGTDGVRLLKAGEAWARSLNATTLYMVAPSPEVERLYAALGYARLETTYERRF